MTGQLQPMQAHLAEALALRLRDEPAADAIPAMRLMLVDPAGELAQPAAGLEDIGVHASVLAQDVERALEVVRDRAVDALVAAVSGPSLLTLLRACTLGAPAVIVVVDTPGDMDTLLGHPDSRVIEEFLVRPVTPELLRARLRLLRHRRAVVTPQQALLQVLPDPMFRIRRDGVLVDYHAPPPHNRYVPHSSITGTPVSELMPAEIARQTMQLIEQVLTAGVPGNMDYQLPTPNGERSYEARVIPYGPDEVLAIVRDVTEHRRMNAELRATAELKRALTARVVSAQEAERQYLSRELHDGIGQMLLVHRMAAEWLAQQAASGTLRDAAEELSSALDHTLESVRNLAMDLRPPAIDDLGIGSALKTLLVSNTRRAGLRGECMIEPGVAYVSTDISVALYRIAQEALCNAIRHAQCQSITVSLGHSEADLELRVVDDGVGFDPMRAYDASCLGLVGMRERGELVGGRVTIDSKANQGTCVKVSIPHVSLPPE